jgi:outer membrane receptor protein involved in Fe transport
MPRLLILCTVLFCLAFPRLSSAQPSPVSGSVVDESGGAIAGARVTLRNAAGAPLETVTTSADGHFVFSTVADSDYVVLVEADLFAPATRAVSARAELPLRVVLRAGGLTENVVVTAARAETRLSETPQKIEIVDAVDVERTVAADLTDLLKKNSGVDVIQYSGALSGLGIRGFRPQFSGINKRSLLLVDGRPSGVTNLATLLLDNVERVEVLKGAASSVYGSSAMGGVVNIITRQSRGKIGGQARVGAGSFGASEFAGRVGGSANSRIDFDAAGTFVDQRDDFRMGNGEVRPATTYRTYDGATRVGLRLNGSWRVEGRADAYRGRDIMTPGDLATGINAQGSKDLERASQDVRLAGHAAAHEMMLTAYHASEDGHTRNVTSTNPLDQPYLPYLTFENSLAWTGLQARDAWRWARQHDLVVGLDYEWVTSDSLSYARTGERIAPFSADSTKRTAGLYAEQTFRFADGRSVVTLGGRADRITTATVDTPLKTNFTPSETTFNVFNPSVGFKHEVIRNVRAHFAAGRAFIPAEASMLTGFTVATVGGRTQISQGNPNLDPERSRSLDVGAEWSLPGTYVDATLFRTVVKDRFISNVVVSNLPPPGPIVVSVANGLDAHISGLDLDLQQRAGAMVGVFANVTHYFTRQERLTSGAQQDILNVASSTVRAGVDVDYRRLTARLSERYVRGRKDNDFNAPGFPIIDYPNFIVTDLSASVRVHWQHSVAVSVNNLFDVFYFEKLGYPLPGAAVHVSYRVGF